LIRGFHDNIIEKNEIVISRLEQFAVLLAKERLGVRMMVIKRAPSRNIKVGVVNVSKTKNVLGEVSRSS
jgi:hypothetical protein